MFCPECGEKLPDNSKFCSKCGAKMPGMMDDQVTMPASMGISYVQPQDDGKIYAQTFEAAPVQASAAPVQPPVQEPPVQQAYAAPIQEPTFGSPPQQPPFQPPEKKAPVVPNVGALADQVASKLKLSKKNLAIAAAATAVMILAVVLVVALVSGGGENAYATLADGDFYLVDSLKKDGVFEIESARSDSFAYNLMSFSPDGKYLYYFTKYDGYEGTGTLCRARYDKLKEDGKNNDKYIEVVDKDVRLGLSFLDDGSLIYETGEGYLYYYDTKEPVRIAKENEGFWVDRENRLLAYVTGDYEDYSLYTVDLKDPENRIKIDSHVSYVCDGTDLRDVFYIMENKDYDAELHVGGTDREPQKLSDRTVLAQWMGGKFYYTKDGEETLPLSDLVEDSGEEADSRRVRMLREWLDSEEGEIPLLELYCYEKGEETLVMGDIVDLDIYSGGFALRTTADLGEKEALEDMESESHIRDLCRLGRGSFQVYLENGETYSVTGSAAETVEEAHELGYYGLYFAPDAIYLEDSEMTLSYAPVKDGEAGKFKVVSDEASVISLQEKVLYYADGIDDGDTHETADVYACEGGESTCLVRDVMQGSYLYEDGVVLAITDYSRDGYELTYVRANGKDSFLADDVSLFRRIDGKHVLYISDGDLYCYDGKDKETIQQDVEYVWTAHGEAVDCYLYW